ncbi:Cell morphogenesis protein PAG1, partial [Coemansia furcata]
GIDDCHSDADTESSSAAAAVMAAALDAKSRMERSAWTSASSAAHSSSSSAMDPNARELNGGFLHVFLDLMHYLEESLCEFQNEEGTASSSALADQASAAQASSVSLPEGDAGSGYADDGRAMAGDLRAVGGRSLVEWVKMVHAIEANAVALLCSSSVRVRHLAVDVLYQAGVLRRILGANEPLPVAGQVWIFRGADSAYEILNVLVPLKVATAGAGAIGKVGSLVGEFWDVPFEAAESPSQANQPLARVAASSADVALWMAYLPQFVGRAIVVMPEVMLVARTLVCQRLYQMQPLMSQYADVSVRAGGLQHGALYVRASGVRTHAAGSSSSSSSSSLVLRADLISAFNSLFLFAVVSLPAGGGVGAHVSSSLGETVIGSRSSPRSGGGAGNGGAFGNSRLAKSIARKLAPLKASSRGSKQEQGVGLASISQLVRMAGALLRSDNAPLRQSAALALCHTPAAYLVELMLELRPLAESLFDDGSSLGSHRHYLHVAGAPTAGGGGSGRDGLLGHYGGGAASPGSAVLSASGDSPKPLVAQQVQRTGSSLLAAAQIAPHGSSKRGGGRAAAAARASAVAAAHGSDTEATSDSGNNHGGRAKSSSSHDAELGAPGRRASSFDATMATGGGGGGLRRPLEGAASGDSSAVAVANAAAAANAAALAAVSGGSGSTSQMRRKRLRLSLAQIYGQVSRHLEAWDADDVVLGQLISYVRETKTFLSEPSVQWEAEHQSLRIHFCGLVEALYFCISAPRPPLPMEGGGTAKHKFTYETRNGLYQLFERWCSLGKHSEAGRDAHARMVAAALEAVKDPGERALVGETLERELAVLGVASLRAMAVLCRDVTPHYSESAGVVPAGCGPRDRAALFAWVSDALDHNDPRVQGVGQRAVEWAVGADPSDTMRVLIQLAYGLSAASSVSNGFAPSAAGAAPAEVGAGSVESPRMGASGLGLMFGSEAALSSAAAAGGYALRQRHNAVGSPPGGSVPVGLSTDRVALGYLRALTSILQAPTAQGALTLTYASLILPLVLFRLRSERQRMRRQALVLLRVVCSHMAVRSCVATLDSLGPSIVSNIPSIAASAARRLTGAVAASFAAHSELAILECVRQVHAQGTVAGRLAAFLEIVEPWVGNIELRSVAADGSEGLGPVALSRDSLVVLRCMLFLTVRGSGVEALAAVQGLWVGLAHSSGNLWLAMRHLTGLLLHTQSLALLAFMRRIAVFLTRSSPPLVRRLVAEARSPAAHAPVEAESI